MQKQEIIHSVGASFSGVIGAYLSRYLKKPHIAQCIGTDVNVTLPVNKDNYFYLIMNNYVDVFTTNSFALEHQVKSIYPSANVKTIYRGVNLEFFNAGNSILEHNKVTFAFIGGLSYRSEHHAGRDYKGGVTLLKAWQSLKNYNDLELHFAGPDVNEGLVQQVLGQDPSDLNIKVSSYLDRAGVKKLFDAADVVVIPSWLEGLPNAGIEALASSCAILGSNIGGVPELVNNNGYIFEPGNIEELAQLLRGIASHPDRLALFKKNSHALALNKFDSIQFSKKYCELYEKI